MPTVLDRSTGLPVPGRTDAEPRRKRRGRVPGPADVAKIDAQVLRDPGVHATPADFGAGIGRSVEAFGAAAFRVADDFTEMRRSAEDDTASAAGLAEARVRFVKAAQSLEARATSGEGFTEGLDAALSFETDAILGDLRSVRGLRPSDQGEAAIRRQLGALRSRFVARGAMFEHEARLNQLGRDIDQTIGDLAMAAFNRPADYLAILAEGEAVLDKFKNKLPPDALAAKVAAARATIPESAVAGLIATDPAAALDALERGDFDAHLAAADKALNLKQARAATAAADRGAVAQAAATTAKAASDLEIAVRRGLAGYAEIERSLKARIITPAKRTQLTLAVDERFKAADKEAADLALVAAAVGTGEVFLDPKDGGHRKAVDAYFQSFVLDDPGGQPDVIAFVDKVGMVPDSLAGQLRGALRAGDAKAKADAADLLDRIGQANPAALRDFAQADVDDGLAIATLVRAGVKPEDAVRSVEAARRVPEPERQARRARAIEEKHGDENASFLEDQSERGFLFFGGADLEIPDALVGEFNLVQRQAFMRLGDLEASQTVALARLRGVWGVTRVGGPPRWMKYAPEAVAGVAPMTPEQNADWMTEQLIADLAKGAIFDPEAGDLEDRLRIEADARTARELPAPSYPVALLNADGVYLPVTRFVDGQEKVFRWQPDWITSPLHQRTLEEIERRAARLRKGVEAARGSRKEVIGRLQQTGRRTRRAKETRQRRGTAVQI